MYIYILAWCFLTAGLPRRHRSVLPRRPFLYIYVYTYIYIHTHIHIYIYIHYIYVYIYYCFYTPFHSWASDATALCTAKTTVLHGDATMGNVMVKRDSRGDADLRDPALGVTWLDFQQVRGPLYRYRFRYRLATAWCNVIRGEMRIYGTRTWGSHGSTSSR